MTYSKTKAFIQEQVYHGSQTPCNSITMTYSKTNTFLEEQIYHVYLDQPTGAHRLQPGRRQTQGMNAVLGPAAQVRLQRLEDQCIPRAHVSASPSSRQTVDTGWTPYQVQQLRSGYRDSTTNAFSKVELCPKGGSYKKIKLN